MSIPPLPFASIQNDFLRLDYLTTTGPRIVGLHVNGVEGNLLAETPDAHWPTPHGEFYLRGGHRLWTAPEDPFYTCPDEEVTVSNANGEVVIQGATEKSGLQKEISIQLDGNCVHLSNKVIWHGSGSIELAPWGITQLRLGGTAFLPLASVESLQPDRNLVLWPYTQIKDERLEIYDDMILLHGKGRDHACKIGNRNSHGWIACAMGSVLFTKSFDANRAGTYPDMNCNVEAYVKDACIELETLGPLQRLQQGDSAAYNETWQITTGYFPPTLETARSVREQYHQ